MKKTRLQFNQLAAELEVLGSDDLRSTKGGLNIQWGQDSAGNVYWRDGESGQWNLWVIELDTVVITPSGGIDLVYNYPGENGSPGGSGESGGYYPGYPGYPVYPGGSSGGGDSGGGSDSADNNNPSFGFAGITIPSQLQSLAQSYFEELIASPIFKTASYFTSAYEAYKTVENASNFTDVEFAYKLSVIGAGVVNAWASLGIVSFVSFAEVMSKAYLEAESFTFQWFYDRMHPTDPNAFFSPIPQEVRDELEAAQEN